MLRITVLDQAEVLTFKLEGRLAGEWVQVLEDCWRSVETRQSKQIVQVDLTEVTSIDALGRACLASLQRQKAQFIAADCLTKAIVAEINGDDGMSRPK